MYSSPPLPSAAVMLYQNAPFGARSGRDSKIAFALKSFCFTRVDYGRGIACRRVASPFDFIMSKSERAVRLVANEHMHSDSAHNFLSALSRYCNAIKIGISPWPFGSGRKALPMTAPNALNGSLVFMA